ncbi:MAG TPA: restriction endonuclease subunit S [Acidobacteriaceae bacterium]|nr:restriction endonuclease subunit S [Acidobacteriaceae bacterium]
MSAAWPSVALGEVLTQDTQYVHTLEPRQYPKLSVKLYGRGVVLDSPADGGTVKMQKHQFARRGQVILSEIWAKKGAIGVVPPEGDGALCTSHFFLFDINRDKALPEFIAWLLSGNYLEPQLNSEARGTTGYAAIRPKQFLATSIPLPPLDEQRRIVARIEELAAKVNEAHKLRNESKKATSAFISATHAELSVSPPQPLSNFIELYEDEVPIVMGMPYSQAGVRGFGGGLFAKPPVYGGQTTYRAFNRLYSGALVMSQVKGWEGAVAMTPRELEGYFVSPEYRTFRCKDNRCLPEYLAALVPTEFFWSRLKDATRGVGARRERTRPEQFLQLQFSMPSLADQKRAITMFANISAVQTLQTRTAAELNAMLPAIIDKAFNGGL